MDLKAIRNELQKLSALVEGWNSAENITPLERDLALGKLRELYDMVRFPAEIPVVAVADEPEITPVEPLSIDLDDVLSLGLVAETEPEFEEPAETESADRIPEPVEEPIAASEPIAEPTVEPEPVAESLPSPEAEPIAAPEPEAEPERESAPVSVSESASVAEPAASSAHDPKPEPQPQQESVATLFELEDDTERHRRKQRVIMSLYGNSEPAAPRPVVSTPKPAPAVVAEADSDEDFEELSVETVRMTPAPAVAPVDETFEAGSQTDTPDPDSDNDAPLTSGEESDNGQATVLGDVMNHHVQTLADTFTTRRDTLSEAVHHAPVKDLRAAIGINDRFLLVRDLFGGDARACDAALDALNSFDDLDDCMIHIAENYAWNPNSDGAKFLMELLERKYL